MLGGRKLSPIPAAREVHGLEELLQLIGLVPWRWIIDGLLMVIDGYEWLLLVINGY